MTKASVAASRPGYRRTLVESERGWREAFAAAESETSITARDIRSADYVVVLTVAPAEWANSLWSRVAELGALPRGWDSYGALPLQLPAVQALSRTIEDISEYVKGSPLVSLMTDGGILCQWLGRQQSVSLCISGQGDVTVQYEHSPSGDEWEAPIEEVSDLGKKIWHSSL